MHWQRVEEMAGWVREAFALQAGNPFSDDLQISTNHTQKYILTSMKINFKKLLLDFS